MKLSTATSVFVNYLLQDAVQQTLQIDLDGIDIWCGRPHLFRKDYSEETIREVGENIQSAGRQVVSVMPAFFRYPFSLSSPVKNIRRDSIAYMKDCIDNAVLVGAHHVLVVPNNHLAAQPKEDAKKLFLSSMESVCDYAHTKNMKLGIETVYPKLSSYMNHTNQALEVICSLGSQLLGVVIDTGHLNLSGEFFESAVNNLGDKLIQVHVNDNNGAEQQNDIPFSGTFDFEKMASVLNRCGYQGFLSIELGWNHTFDPVYAVSASVQRLRSL